MIRCRCQVGILSAALLSTSHAQSPWSITARRPPIGSTKRLAAAGAVVERVHLELGDPVPGTDIDRAVILGGGMGAYDVDIIPGSISRRFGFATWSSRGAGPRDLPRLPASGRSPGRHLCTRPRCRKRPWSRSVSPPAGRQIRSSRRSVRWCMHFTRTPSFAPGCDPSGPHRRFPMPSGWDRPLASSSIRMPTAIRL